MVAFTFENSFDMSNATITIDSNTATFECLSNCPACGQISYAAMIDSMSQVPERLRDPNMPRGASISGTSLPNYPWYFPMDANTLPYITIVTLGQSIFTVYSNSVSNSFIINSKIVDEHPGFVCNPAGFTFTANTTSS